jgi:surface antigen
MVGKNFNLKLGLFVGSIAALVIYLQRDNIFKGAKYIRQKFGDLVSSFASKWVGIKELGENRAFANDVFQKMMQKVGWKSSESWCMYFAKAIHYEVNKDNPSEQAKINRVLNGRTQESFVNAQNDKSGTYTTSSTPQKGDIMIFQNTSNSSKGHAGVVIDVDSANKKVTTIEGNTSDKSIADGDLVARKVRPSSIGADIGGLKVRGYIRKLNV